MDSSKTDPGVGTGHSKTDEGWMVVGDKHGKSKEKDRVRWESSVAGWVGRDTGLGSSRVVVVDSSGAWREQRNDEGHQDDQRWIRMQRFSCPAGVDREVCPSFREREEVRMK